MPQDWGSPALPFLAVGRVSDGVILAYYSGTETAEQEELNKDVFRKLLGAASTKLAHGQRTRLAWNEGSVCCLMDQQGANLYCVVTALLTYPERLAYQLLYDLVVACQQLNGLKDSEEYGQNEALQPRMKELVEQYEDPSNFPSMQSAMEKSGGTFEQQAAPDGGIASQRQQQQRNQLLLGVIAVVVLLILVVIWLNSKGDKGDGKKAEKASLAQALLNSAASQVNALLQDRKPADSEVVVLI